MIKAILFDMDGVLFDSMPSHAKAWFETMQQYVSGSSFEDYYMFEGRTGSSTINILFKRFLGRNATEEEKQAIYAQKSKRFSELDQAKPMPGAINVLEKVKENNLDTIIVTGSGQVSLFEKINTYFPGYFDKKKMVTAYDVKHGKPNPEPYLLGLEKAGVKPNEAIVIENAPLGIEAAKAANIYTIAVNTGPLQDEVLLQAGADHIFPSMSILAENIVQIINQLNNSR